MGSISRSNRIWMCRVSATVIPLAFQHSVTGPLRANIYRQIVVLRDCKKKTIVVWDLRLLFFVLRNPSLQSTWLLQRSVTVCCPLSFHTSSVLCCCSSSDFLTVCPWFSQRDCFLLLNFNLRSNLNLVFSCFLGNLQFLSCCHASLVPRHRSNFLRDFVRLGLKLVLFFLFF